MPKFKSQRGSFSCFCDTDTLEGRTDAECLRGPADTFLAWWSKLSAEAYSCSNAMDILFCWSAGLVSDCRSLWDGVTCGLPHHGRLVAKCLRGFESNLEQTQSQLASVLRASE